MRITFNIPEFTHNERNSHCDVLHITPVRVARLVLDDAIAAIQRDVAIKAYGDEEGQHGATKGGPCQKRLGRTLDLPSLFSVLPDELWFCRIRRVSF